MPVYPQDGAHDKAMGANHSDLAIHANYSPLSGAPYHHHLMMEVIVENRIEERCAELGVTQKWLSEQSGVPESEISAIKTGRRVPGIDVAILIAAALNTDVEDIFKID